MIRINLLPVREERRKAGIRQLAILLVATLVGSLAICAAFHAKVVGDVSSARDQLAETQRQIDSYKAQVAKVEEFRTTKEQIEKKLEVIERLERSRSGPVRVMDEIATHTPERLWVTRLQTRNGRVTLEGMSLDNELVAVFLTALNDSAVFSNVELEETRARELEGLKLNEFKLSATLATGTVTTTTASASAMPGGAGR